MNLYNETFASLDRVKGIPHLPAKQEEEMPLPAWYRSVYDVPLDQLTIEDLCKAARQQIHPEQIVPLVIRTLEKEPLAGEMFEGELLVSLRSLPAVYWKSHPDEGAALNVIVDTAWNAFSEDVQDDVEEILRDIKGPKQNDTR